MYAALIVSTVVLWIIVIGNALLTLALTRRASGLRTGYSVTTGTPAGDPVVDFAAETLGGGRVTLADFGSRPAIFVFVSSNCKACENAMPIYRELCELRSSHSVDTMFVTGDSPEQARLFADKSGLTCPVLIATRGTNPMFGDWSIKGTPAYVAIEGGYVVESGIAQKSTPNWVKLIDSLSQRADRAARRRVAVG
jgi:peroxiredoxin